MFSFVSVLYIVFLRGLHSRPRIFLSFHRKTSVFRRKERKIRTFSPFKAVKKSQCERPAPDRDQDADRRWAQALPQVVREREGAEDRPPPVRRVYLLI